MLIITPVAGSMPEPRPQYLVTGDRAVSILDAASSAALQANGVKLTNLSLTTFNTLVQELVPAAEEFDPSTGKLLPAYVPDYLSQASINALNLLDPTVHTVEEQYIPSRLSATNINSMVLAQNSTVTDTDPDGYPVIVGGASTTTDLTVSGNLNYGNGSGATMHADTFTANQATTTYAESAAFVTDNQSTEPGAPAAGKLKIYSDANGRLVYKDQNAELYHAPGKRIVTAWPAPSDSYLGDEAINSTTGEHRIYLGATKGWRLASPHEVYSLTERDAITNKYEGMKVYVNNGVVQDHIWLPDNKWHGTVPYSTALVGNYPVQNINDTNWRVLYAWDVLDPGFPYIVEIKAGFEVVAFNVNTRSFVECNTSDYQSWGTGAVGFLYAFQDAHQGYAYGVHRYDVAGETNYVLEGSHSAQLYWKINSNWANAYSMNYQAYANCRIIPA